MLLFMLGAMLMLPSDLPSGSAPAPVAVPHFPDRLHVYVWRNWPLVPTTRLAKVVGAKPAEIISMGRAMGLSDPPAITAMQQRRSYLTVIRRNWHLLPYSQLLQLLGWTEEQMAYTLREDDFLYIKLGSLKPRCEPLSYHPPDKATQQREQEITRILKSEFPEGVGETGEPLFRFVEKLSQRPQTLPPDPLKDLAKGSRFSPRFCYSYFALYGDPLLEKEADPYPEGYLERMAASGVNGVWLQAVLYKLAPFPWNPALSEKYQARLRNLKALTARAKKHGIRVYLYLNEPRAMPLAFYENHPEMKGAVEGEHAALCTSQPAVQKYMTEAVASICRAVPDLGGFFTITGSENLTNCWSHGGGKGCPRCGKRTAAEVIAEVNEVVEAGIRQSGSKAELIAWDWGWPDDQAEAIITHLPLEATLMSVSEWSLPLRRGGIESIIGEYSLSAVGPGPRALKHWEIARKRGLKTIAKIQAGNSWELSTVPYVPAVENAAQHAANLRNAGVDGLMLGWTLGGYPSPNLEVVSEMGKVNAEGKPIYAYPDEALKSVAVRRCGPHLASRVVQAWKEISASFREFPYHAGVVYTAPLQLGVANPLWSEPTGYSATMVGFPYDDLDSWRVVYPTPAFVSQLTRAADGFDRALTALKQGLTENSVSSHEHDLQALREEIGVAEAASIHFRSVAQQARFVAIRRELVSVKTAETAAPLLAELQSLLDSEIELARRLYAIQSRDSRIGFEASNQYSYVPIDLAEKVLNCHELRDRWLPEQKAKFGIR